MCGSFTGRDKNPPAKKIMFSNLHFLNFEEEKTLKNMMKKTDWTRKKFDKKRQYLNLPPGLFHDFALRRGRRAAAAAAARAVQDEVGPAACRGFVRVLRAAVARLRILEIDHQNGKNFV